MPEAKKAKAAINCGFFSLQAISITADLTALEAGLN